MSNCRTPTDGWDEMNTCSKSHGKRTEVFAEEAATTAR